jgi:hypothetical protein
VLLIVFCFGMEIRVAHGFFFGRGPVLLIVFSFERGSVLLIGFCFGRGIRVAYPFLL